MSQSQSHVSDAERQAAFERHTAIKADPSQLCFAVVMGSLPDDTDFCPCRPTEVPATIGSMMPVAMTADSGRAFALAHRINAAIRGSALEPDCWALVVGLVKDSEGIYMPGTLFSPRQAAEHSEQVHEAELAQARRKAKAAGKTQGKARNGKKGGAA